MIAVALFAVSACLPVAADSDRIQARDLVSALPELAALPPDAPLALAPEPGVTRVFHVPELRRLEARWQLPETAERTVCVTRPVAQLDPAQLLEAMRRELPGARIAIAGFSRQPVPRGMVEFPRQGLRRGPAGELWTGWVRYARDRRFPIWAQVEVTAGASRVVAAADLKAGHTITAGEVVLVKREEFPDAVPWATSLEQAVGKRARLAVTAGSELRLDALETPKDVERGDLVKVQIRSGGAVLETEGRAEASGSAGDIIAVTNPGSQKRYRAQVKGKGNVAVTVAPIEEKP